MNRCSKHRHKSKGAAESQLRALLARENDIQNAETLCTYLCHHCGFWHVGHNEMGIRPEPMAADPAGETQTGRSKKIEKDYP